MRHHAGTRVCIGREIVQGVECPIAQRQFRNGPGTGREIREETECRRRIRPCNLEPRHQHVQFRMHKQHLARLTAIPGHTPFGDDDGRAGRRVPLLERVAGRTEPQVLAAERHAPPKAVPGRRVSPLSGLGDVRNLVMGAGTRPATRDDASPQICAHRQCPVTRRVREARGTKTFFQRHRRSAGRDRRQNHENRSRKVHGRPGASVWARHPSIRRMSRSMRPSRRSVPNCASTRA